MYTYFRLNEPSNMGLISFKVGDIVRGTPRTSVQDGFTVTHKLVDGRWVETFAYGINERFISNEWASRISEHEAKGVDRKPLVVFNPYQLRDAAAWNSVNVCVDKSEDEVLQCIYDDMKRLTESERLDEIQRFGYSVRIEEMFDQGDDEKVFIIQVFVNLGALSDHQFVQGRFDNDGNINVKFPSGLG